MPMTPQKSAPQNDKVKKPPKYLKMVCVFFVLACVIALFFKVRQGDGSFVLASGFRRYVI